MSDCSKFLSEQSGLSFDSIQWRLRTRIDNYLGYKIKYTEPDGEVLKYA